MNLKFCILENASVLEHMQLELRVMIVGLVVEKDGI
jgi:hypothetical protein